MKVSELTGAQLDYWMARAEGIPAENLTIRRVQRSTDCHVVRSVPVSVLGYPGLHQVAAEVMRYSTDWAQGGPLITRHRVSVGQEYDGECWASILGHANVPESDIGSMGSTELEAICRVVVRAAFGDDVDEVPVQPA